MKYLYLFAFFPIICFAQDKLQKRCLKPVKSMELERKISEGSGLVFWNGRLWAHNDSGNAAELFSIDTTTATIIETYHLPIPNKDWEDISQDETHFYLADVGNNYNRRESLQIYRIDKQSLLDRKPVIDSIVFRWPEEANDTGNRRRRNYNCEALVVSGDSIFVFTKESKRTAMYSIPKLPGEYDARFKAKFKTKIHITGACLNPDGKRLVLCGYNKWLRTFLLDFSNYESSDFFSGDVTQVRIRKRFRQTEGIASPDGKNIYLINEHFRQPWLVNKKPEIHVIRI